MTKKKQKGQLILLIIGILIIFLIYFNNPNTKKKNLSNSIPSEMELEDNLKTDQDSSFENIEYKGLYDVNKSFVVKSKKAHVLNEDPDIVYMNEMHVILNLANGKVVNITSNKGIYNKATYDCFFEQNVKASDGETKIFSDNLNLLATKNSVEIYSNVTINNPSSTLKADKISYDFETKLFKILSNDDKLVKMKLIKWLQKNSEL